MSHLVIIGGSDAGISAALRAREHDAGIRVSLVVADRLPNYSICGIPFYFSQEVTDWHHLAHRTSDEITSQGIELLLEHTAQRINPDEHTVMVRNPAGETTAIPYDKLIIGTGASPIKPPIDGIDTEGVFLLRTMADMFTIDDYINRQKPTRTAIIGAGYIGLEMAEALAHRGMQVTVLERMPSVLVTVDSVLGDKVQKELEAHGVRVKTGITVEHFSPSGGGIHVQGTDGFEETFDMVLVSVGVRPNTELAQTAGAKLGQKGAIQVDHHMQTSLPDVYAAGDCVETWHRVTQRDDYVPLGSTAHKQGRIAGENAAGGNVQFQGTLGTQVVKLFNLVAARTGLRDHEALAAGFTPFTTMFETWDHKVYYPGAQRIIIRVTGDLKTRKLLGAQVLGHRNGEISKRVDIFAAALYHNMTVDAINDLDLTYTPPLSSPWDPVQMAAQAWERAVQAHQLDPG